MTRSLEVVEIIEELRITAMLLNIKFSPDNVIHVHAETATLAQYANLAERITR
jgi:hypothetical protein